MSIVIPVYNIEKYISRCIDSITAQTYSNLEIIIVDDGSSDSTEKICDEYASRDKRITVIHQENKGCGESWNVGLRQSNGEWIQFVDGDDWLDPDAIEKCLSFAQKYKADVVCFRCVREYETGRKAHENKTYSPPRLIDTSEALSIAMLPMYVDVFTWNKLMRKELCKGIEFPQARIGDDGYTTYKFIARAERVLLISDVLYHFFMRQNSTSRTTFTPVHKNISDYAEKYFDFVVKSGIIQKKEQMMNAQCGLWFRKICYASEMLQAGFPDMEYISQLRREIKPLVVLRCRVLNFKRKAQFLLFKFSLRLYKAAYMRYKY